MRLTTLPLLGTFVIPALAATSTTIVRATPVPSLSTAQWISEPEGFDSPKVSPINSITWDRWYFDAVQVSENPTEKASFVATFYSAGVSGFEPLLVYANEGYTSIALAELVVVCHNGTRDRFLINGTEAGITTGGNGASAVCDGVDGQASFSASPNMRYYHIEVESEGIKGILSLQSVMLWYSGAALRRKRGENATYPPLMSSDTPTGHKINVELPDGAELDYTATIRWTGSLELVDEEGESFVGGTFVEQFAAETE
ncbi:uncharacterized protein BJX67DRAFT_380989 [Aspergillus lucknowensis]|uniref:Concanavalin A-like lectin/glucanase n=1 Tax=Aspergillus lucknowensis TaxID=176173 RepID=A0ABR4LT10_9EURO